MNHDRNGDFLPSLSQTKEAIHPTIIPLDVLGGPLPLTPEISKNCHGQSLEKDTHSG
jgi:hypothetical protein